MIILLMINIILAQRKNDKRNMELPDSNSDNYIILTSMVHRVIQMKIRSIKVIEI